MLQQKNECCDIMKIRRLNYVMTMDFYIATLPEKFLKKVPELCHDIKSLVVTRMEDRRQEKCHNILLLCRDKDQGEWR